MCLVVCVVVRLFVSVCVFCVFVKLLVCAHVLMIVCVVVWLRDCAFVRLCGCVFGCVVVYVLRLYVYEHV